MDYRYSSESGSGGLETTEGGSYRGHIIARGMGIRCVVGN